MDAKWIGFNSDTVHTSIDVGDVFGCYAQYYRKAFSLKEKPIKATAKLSALGFFVAYVNGKKVSNEYFAPGWTNYRSELRQVLEIRTLSPDGCPLYLPL